MSAGLDHDWFPFRPLAASPALALPPGKRVALWIGVPLEFFPLDMPTGPVKPTGGLERPYPDLWVYAQRDYGNRIGIYRILRVLERCGIRATAFVNAALARRTPRLLDDLARAGWELAASGIDMARIVHGGVARDDENALIGESLALLRASWGDVVGWQSPAQSGSQHTPELLAAAGIRYVADWANDDLPYTLATPAGPLVALPVGLDWSDRALLVQHDRTIADWEDAVLRAFDRLASEARAAGPRVLALSVTPWVIGYPHRIGGLQRVLARILADSSVVALTGRELAAASSSRGRAPTARTARADRARAR